MATKGKTHFINADRLEANERNSWAACGQLVPNTSNYDEDVEGRNEITCGNCRRVVKSQDRFQYA